MSELKVSIIIVNYNVKELLLVCLRTLYSFHKNHKLFEVIVVDNDSKDGSVEAIRKEFGHVTIIENKDNAGFPKGNNQGFAVAKGEYIFMLNPDTEFIENTVEKLSTYLDNHTGVTAVAPGLLNTDGTKQSSVWRFPKIASVFCETFHLSKLLKKKNYLDKDISKEFEAESISGAAIFFRSAILDSIGNLDETLFWIEDIDFCYRIVHNNMKIIYYPETKIYHHTGQSAKKNYNISISNQVYNKVKFYKKYHSKSQTAFVILISYISVFMKIAIFGLLSPFNVVYKRKARAYIYTLPRILHPPKGVT